MAKGCAIFETATSYARLSSSVPSNGNFTIGGWFYIESRASGVNETFFYVDSTSDLGVRMSSGNTLRLSGPGTDITTSVQPSAGEWIYLALAAVNDVNCVVYHYNSSYSQRAAHSIGSAINAAVSTVTIGADNTGAGGFDGNLRASQVRLWSATLNQSQIEAELQSSTPVITGSLLESFENDPATDGWTTNGTVTVSTTYFPPNYGGDSTAPVLTSPIGTPTGTTTATVGATTDEGNGTLYAVVTTSATQPSVAQIKAGQNHLGAAATWSGNQAISSTGAKTFSATGLTTGTTYYAHFVHTDAATNNSAVSSTTGFVPGYVLSVTPATLTPSPQSVSLILVGELNYTLVINAPATVTPSTQIVALSLATPVSNLVVTPVTSNIVFSVTMPITRTLCSPLTQSVALNATGQPNTYVLTVTPVSPTITPQDVALNPSYALSGSGTSYRQRRRVSYATRYFSRG